MLYLMVLLLMPPQSLFSFAPLYTVRARESPGQPQHLGSFQRNHVEYSRGLRSDIGRNVPLRIVSKVFFQQWKYQVGQLPRRMQLAGQSKVGGDCNAIALGRLDCSWLGLR